MARPRISSDEGYFFAELRGEGWGVFFSFPKPALEQGESLARLMNLRVRETIQSGRGIVPQTELKQLAKEAMPELRAVVDASLAPKR